MCHRKELEFDPRTYASQADCLRFLGPPHPRESGLSLCGGPWDPPSARLGLSTQAWQSSPSTHWDEEGAVTGASVSCPLQRNFDPVTLTLSQRGVSRLYLT